MDAAAIPGWMDGQEWTQTDRAHACQLATFFEPCHLEVGPGGGSMIDIQDSPGISMAMNGLKWTEVDWPDSVVGRWRKIVYSGGVRKRSSQSVSQ